mgnify:CR=1 FL=1
MFLTSEILVTNMCRIKNYLAVLDALQYFLYGNKKRNFLFGCIYNFLHSLNNLKSRSYLSSNYCHFYLHKHFLILNPELMIFFHKNYINRYWYKSFLYDYIYWIFLKIGENYFHVFGLKNTQLYRLTPSWNVPQGRALPALSSSSRGLCTCRLSGSTCTYTPA